MEKKDELASLKEAAYIRGQKAVWRNLIQQGLSTLEGNEYTRSELLLERAEAINALSMLCEEFDLPIAWNDSLHLADIIEKHIYRSLRARRQSDGNNQNGAVDSFTTRPEKLASG